MAEAPEGADALRYDIALTSRHVADTAGEIRERLAEKRAAVADRLDLAEYARAHPWIALGIAVGAGVLLGGGGDRAAARATAGVARRTGHKAVDLAKAAPGAAAGAATGLVTRVLHRDDRAPGEPGYRLPDDRGAMDTPGFASRLREQADAFVVDLREESERIGRPSAG